MAKYYYNGVLLPEIPADVIATYPYAWIRKNTTSGYYDLIFSHVPYYYETTPGIYEGNGVTGMPWYRVSIAESGSALEWTDNTSANTFTWWGLDSNRTVMWSNHNIMNGSETSTTIYFEGSNPVCYDHSYIEIVTAEPTCTRNGVKTFTCEECGDSYTEEIPSTGHNLVNGVCTVCGKSGRYSIAEAILDAVARQIMRLTDSTEKVKPEEFEAKLESVCKGGELPSAEDAYFGMRDTGLQESITDYGVPYNGSGTTGCQFTPLKDFVVFGVKVLAKSTVYPNKIRLFDVETQEELLSLDAVGSEWVEIILNEQINLYAGKTYAISVYNGYGCYFSPSETSFNPNIKYVGGYYNSDEVATCPTNNSEKRICAAIVTLAPKPEENIIYEYKIQTTTLNDIADEVIRITGRSDSMSPASILSALQGIETVTTEE